jgi:hypothetical protein
MIESYRFGEIVIDGKCYTSDVVILPGSVRDGWWRREGHRVWPEDLAEALEASPEVVVVGRGAPGLMDVPDRTREYLASRGIKLVVERTEEACRTYNQLCGSQRVVAALHLSC